MEPQIYDENASFVTKTFFVRYAEEQICLRDVIKFRTEIDTARLCELSSETSNAKHFLLTDFFLRVELYYAVPPQDCFARAVNSADVMKEEVNKPKTKFKCV